MGNCISRVRLATTTLQVLRRQDVEASVTALSDCKLAEDCFSPASLHHIDCSPDNSKREDHPSEHASGFICKFDVVHDVENLLSLARAVNTRYQHTWDLADVDQRLEIYRKVLSLLDSMPADFFPRSLQIPSTDSHHFPETGHLAQLPRNARLDTKQYTQIQMCLAFEDHSIHLIDNDQLAEWKTLAREVVQSLPDGHSLLTPALCSLGAALRTQSQTIKSDVSIVKEAVSAFRQAMYLCHTQGYACDTCLDQLGWCLFRLYLPTGNRDVMLEGLFILKSALERRPPGHPRRHQTLYQIAMIYQQDLETTPEQLQEGLRLSKEALSYLVDGHRDKPAILYAQSACLYTLHSNTGDMTQLHNAVLTCREGLSLCYKGHPDRFKLLSGLGHHLIQRYVISGDKADMDESAELLQEGLDSCGYHHPLYQLFSGMLAWTLELRFENAGNVKDLDRCIALHRHVLDNTPSGHPQRGSMMNNMAASLSLYFHYSGLTDFLHESVRLHREAREILREQRAFASFLNSLENLGSGLSELFKTTGDPRALDEAIEALEEARNHERSRFEGRMEILQHLGISLRLRYGVNHCPDDLDRAILCLTQALELKQGPHRSRDKILTELASATATRAKLKRDLVDLSMAMQHQHEALTLLSPSHPRFCEATSCLGLLHLIEAEMKESSKPLDIATQLLSESLSNGYNHPQHRLTEALGALKAFETSPAVLLMTREQSQRLLEIYRTSISLLPRVALVGLNVRARLQVLAQAEALAPKAATRAIRVCKPEVAIELLEEGRAVFWTQHLRLRQTGRLPEPLALRFSRLSEQLRHVTLTAQKPTDDEDEDEDSKGQALASQTHKMRSLSEMFDELVAEVRASSGLKNFMEMPSFSVLRAISNEHPIVLLVSDEVGSHGILLIPGMEGPHVVDLKLTSEELRQYEDQMIEANATLRKVNKKKLSSVKPEQREGKDAVDVLSNLWTNIMSPVLDALGWKKQTGRQRPRLWLCPTSAFSNLPVHAAGVYSENEGNYCSQYFVASYTPTLTALLDARRNLLVPRRSDAKVLLATVAQPFNLNPLDCVVEEAQEISRIISEDNLLSTSDSSNPPGSPIFNATASQVLESVAGASILHMACHGQLNIEDPLSSGFVMSDGMLTLAQLMSLDLPNAFLAFLSACETAKADGTQPDQAINLSATMLYAGFRSVIGTMWSMNDFDGPFIAKAVYSALFEEDRETLDPDVIPYALDAAVDTLRRQTPHPSRWALYVHTGV